MKVVLLKAVEHIGELGQVVDVKDGYARNLLFPNNLAVVANTGALRHLEGVKEQQKRKAQKRLAQDQALAKALEAASPLRISTTAGEEGKLFGTITPKEVARLLSEKAAMEVDRKTLTLDSAINRLGAYQVTVKLSPLVSAKVQVLVEAEVVAEEEASA
jgi:large subunit ribosomal protein L9